MGDHALSRHGKRAAAMLLTGIAMAVPGTAVAAECAGDECQGPPPAPEETIPGTAVVQGPPNPPVRFPGHGGKRHGKKHPRKHGHKRSGR